MITGRTKEIFKTSKGKYIAPAPIESKVVDHPCIELAWVGGSGEAQPYAVIVLSEDARKAVGEGGSEDLTRDLEQHLETVNRDLATFEQLLFLSVVDDEWTPENGLLTPTMKIRRAKIEAAYSDQSEGWYGQGKALVWAH